MHTKPTKIERAHGNVHVIYLVPGLDWSRNLNPVRINGFCLVIVLKDIFAMQRLIKRSPPIPSNFFSTATSVDAAA
jgi:hypothetical protein